MFYILAAIFLWSSLAIVIRLSGAPVHLLIFFSCLFSSCLIGCLFLKERFRREIPHRRGLPRLLIIGPISLANSFSFYYAYQNTTVANAVLTHYTAPVLVAFLAPIFLKERLTIRILAAIAAATLGLWIMLNVSPGRFISLLSEGDRTTGGILAGLFSGFCYAVLVILFRVLASGYHPLVMTFFQNLTIVCILLPFAAAGPSSRPFFWAYAVMGIVHSTIAPVLYFKGFKVVTANTAAILGYLEPVCAILLGVLFLGEGVTYKTVLGGCIILFSGYLTVKR